MISSGQWTYVLIKMLINSNSHKENQIIQQLTTLILCNLSFLLFQTIQYAQFFCLKSQKIPINSYFQVLCAVIAHYTTAVSYKLKKQSQRFALQELLKQFLAMSRYITAISYQLKTNCGKAIAIVFWWQYSLYSSCKI